jgi:solute carrier family 35, member E1
MKFDFSLGKSFLGLQIFLYTIIYYVTSSATSIWNKDLVDDGDVSPTLLTLLNLIISLVSDVMIMRYFSSEPVKFPPEHGRHTTSDIIRAFFPISIFVILSKLTTYYSYQYVSVALSHTAKASEPIFNVIVAYVMFNEVHTTPILISLVPIAVGVTLASVTEFSFNSVGFFWAVVSALCKVLQNIYTKQVMNASGNKFTFWEVHLYCGGASLIILLPYLLYEMMYLKLSIFSHVPLFSLLSCSVLQWLSSISSYRILHLVAHLTFTIINVLKRLMIILSGGILYHQVLHPVNIFGVIIAVFGILLYQVSKEILDDSLSPNSQLDPSLIHGPRNIFQLRSWSSWLSMVIWSLYHKNIANITQQSDKNALKISTPSDSSQSNEANDVESGSSSLSMNSSASSNVAKQRISAGIANWNWVSQSNGSQSPKFPTATPVVMLESTQYRDR